MHTVHKYPLDLVDDIQQFPSYQMARFVHVGLDPAGILCVWGLVNTDNTPIVAKFVVVGTGHTFKPSWSHVGSATQDSFVWHIFEVK